MVNFPKLLLGFMIVLWAMREPEHVMQQLIVYATLRRIIRPRVPRFRPHADFNEFYYPSTDSGIPGNLDSEPNNQNSNDSDTCSVNQTSDGIGSLDEQNDANL